nr:double-stranded RNA-binding protein 5-like isoform X1 [Quercus suber]
MADMYKNQLQELAQRSCFNLPSYACFREGPDHAPRFKASVNFNGEIFESPSYCTTLRQAEHAAAEVALSVLSTRGPARSLTARVLDETGIYKNLLQETAHRAGLNLPVYTTIRSGPGHVPIFTCTVELAGMNFTGEPAKTKKQAEKNAAIAAWSALKKLPNLGAWTNKEAVTREEQDQAVVTRFLSNFRPKDDFKQARRRDQNQAKRRMVRSHRDFSCGSSSTSSNHQIQHQQWRLLDLLLDSASEGSSQIKNSFVSLLPPPPPRTASKILPPTSPRDTPSPYSSNRSIPVKVRGRSQIITPPLEEHQRDEEEWLGGKSDAIKKPIEKEGPSNSSSNFVYGASSIYRQFSMSNTGKVTSSMLDRPIQHEQSQIRNRPFGSAQDKVPTNAHMARTMYTGGFNPHRIAPAVQIRSVIPVCAAPPPMRRQQPSNPPTMKGTSSSTLIPSPSTSIGEEVSSASSKFNNKPQLSSTSTQLSSEFNKLQLL